MLDKSLTMTTIEKIEAHYEEVALKAASGQPLTKDEKAVIQIWNSLHAKKSPLGGKRMERDSAGKKRYR